MTAVENLLTSPDTAGVWNLVPGRSTIAFQNKTFWGLVNVKGTFGEFSGDGQVTGKGAVFGRIDIRAASLNTGIRKRDRHLRSADFFDVEKYPEMSVVVTGAQPADGERAELRASLTVKGITRPIELPVTAGRRDDGTIAVSGRTTLNRSDFEVTGNMMGMMGATTMVSGDLVFRRVD
jgi:polyisoprenoid-binding protein YceI